MIKALKPKDSKLSLNAHAAARDAKSEVAKFAAHAAGQAVATWHVPTHALGAFSYAGKATITARMLKETSMKIKKDQTTDK